MHVSQGLEVIYKKNPYLKCKARSCAFSRWLRQIPVPKILRNIFEPSRSPFLFRIKITSSFSAVKIYDIHIFICILHPRAYYELIESLRAQWIEHCTDIAEVMDSNLVLVREPKLTSPVVPSPWWRGSLAIL